MLRASYRARHAAAIEPVRAARAPLKAARPRNSSSSRQRLRQCMGCGGRCSNLDHAWSRTALGGHVAKHSVRRQQPGC